ncbi:unnamed protein product [Rotaria magnacalcarata]|nr:unnamed protein product [Rotaria magnacalcarata]
MHGSVSEIFRNSPITNQWLSGQTRIMKGNTFIKALHMRTNTTPTLVSTSRGREVDKKCRRCGLVDETLIHILQTCPFTQGMRCHRHNNVCRKVSEKLRVKGFQVFQEQGVPSPPLQTNVSRPDIIAIRGDQALVLDSENPSYNTMTKSLCLKAWRILKRNKVNNLPGRGASRTTTTTTNQYIRAVNEAIQLKANASVRNVNARLQME